jgi:hypothetical protein
MTSKFVLGLVAVMVILAIAPSSFAQVNLQVFTNPSTQEVQTARNAQTGDPLSSGAGILVSGSTIASISLTATTLSIDYPAAVTASTGVPSGDPVRIDGATGIFTGAAISSINYLTGVVDITLPGGPVVSPASGSFRLVGVRIDANGLTAPATVTYSLSSQANGYILSSASGTVINAFGPGIASVAANNTASIFTNRTVPDPTGNIRIVEGFANAWRDNVTFPGTMTETGRTTPNPYQIRLTFSGIPAGVTLTLAVAGSTSSTLTASLGTTTVTTDANTAVVSINESSATAAETLDISVSIGSIGSSVTLAPGGITVTGTMAPVGTGLLGTDVPRSATYPNFAAAEVGPAPIISITPATTTLLVPFAVRDGAFDTGISLANTSLDLFGSSSGATATTGAIQLSFFPRTATGAGTPFSISTSSTVKPGIGLDANGNLAAGATWTVLLSELLTAAGQTGPFTGYIFITTNFLNAHGAPFVSDFRNFTSFTPMLVLPPPVTTGRGTPAGGVEALDF